MNQIKIGKFIAKCRKKNNLTQMQLAEKLNITDRAISKWENGKGMPDSSIMLDLCNELKISVNELLCGELIEMNNYNEVAEKMLLEMAQYVPKYSQVYFAMHSGTTRYMKCPKCNKKSWQRKTLSK
ncbi:MAG: helix-turn-helix domain-containing protein [Clostridia bacterium]|jgi:transcriptional regulator with XRE-family HTH domain